MSDSLLKVALSFFFGGLVSLLTITNPLSKIPVFLSLAVACEESAAHREAARAGIYAFLLLTAGLFAGVAILEAFGISYGALRIAGGITVALIGHRMLFGTAESMNQTASGKSFAFFPLAMPGIAGPGALATVIGVSTEIAELGTGLKRATAYAATVAGIALTCLLTWAVLRSARMASHWLGEEGLNVVSRLTGFLLVCIGVQFVGSGVRTFMAGA